MAKLKAPLMSLGASGALGEALVFFPWKGLNVVREYVIPANPRTAGQTTQRGYLSDAVAVIHQYQALPAGPFGPTDIMAYALLGSTYPTPRTWFNQAVKSWVDLKVLGKIPTIFGSGIITPGANQLTFNLAGITESSAIVGGFIYYGTSKTALIYTLAASAAELLAGKVIPGLVKGVKYFVQFRPDDPVGFIGNRSGIYYGVPL